MSHYIQEQNGANKRQLSSSLNRNYSISYTSIPTSPIEILFRHGKVKFTSEMREDIFLPKLRVKNKYLTLHWIGPKCNN